MALNSGTNLGPYQILAPLGAGGMGEVYRARDVKLDRSVAIKVLPDALARDPERLARFEREAKVLASLNHPNIAQIYGVEESHTGGTGSTAGVRALVMELVPGAPIKGPLPLETALNYAQQIASALEAAHERGIVHRDLKPANILVTSDDVVKVLDFGLASVENREQQEVDPSNSPTMSVSPTRAGMIMGTAAYMSPEQARGKVVDKRTDIWAFGVVLYEIIAGKPLFSGETVSDIFVEVLRTEPDLSALPEPARFIVERCLRKDPRKRWQAIGDVRIALEEGAHAQPAALPGAADAHEKTPRWLPWAIAGGLLLITALASFSAWRANHVSSATENLPVMRFDTDLGTDVTRVTYASTFAALSPDGSRVVYTVRSPSGKPMLAIRLMDRVKGTPLPGTEGGHDPFFSPDGQWVGFFAETQLKKISVSGGAPVNLAEVSNPRGASWGEDGTIVGALINTAGLFRVSADGGGASPQPLTHLNAGESTHRWPQVLPGGRIALFTSSDNLSDYENANVEAVDIKTGERKVVQPGAYFGRLTPSGHLLYVHNAIVFAEAMAGAASPVKNLAALKPQSSPVPVVDDVASLPSSGTGQFDFSQNGLFVYESGKSSPDMWSMVGWNGATGAIEFGPNSPKSQLQISKPAPYFTPRFSPDGKRLALGIETKGLDIYVYDFPSDVITRLTFTGQLSYNPVWTPDGRHIVFQTVSGNDHALMWIRSDGGGGAQKLLEGKSLLVPRSFTPDGKFLAYHSGLQNNSDLWVLPLDLTNPDQPKAGQPEALVGTPANEKQPAISPDGRWVAYSSDESGVDEIYVRPFHGKSDGKWQISSGGGNIPGWSRDGKVLYFENLDGRIMETGYEAKGDSFAASKPHAWTEHQLVAPTGDPNFDISPDGKTIVALVRSTLPGNEAESVKATFLVNFFDELRRRAGTAER